MKAFLSNVRFISLHSSEYINKETGEVRVYHKGLFVQDGSEPLTLSVSDSVLGSLNPLSLYDLDLDVNYYNKRFSVKVVEASEC